MRPPKYNPETDLYYVTSGAVTLGIPFAFLQAYKRIFRETKRSGEERLTDWYNSLPKEDKKLFRITGAKQDPDGFYPDQHYED